MRVGDKVICIKRGKWESESEYSIETYPVYNQKLTIRNTRTACGCLYLVFNEIGNPIIQYRDGLNEVAFCSTRFRKLESHTATVNEFNFNSVEEGLENVEPEKVMQAKP